MGALIGGIFSLLAAFAGAHHEDWVEGRRKNKERKETLEYSSEMKVILKEELIQEVLEAIEKLEHAKNNP